MLALHTNILISHRGSTWKPTGCVWGGCRGLSNLQASKYVSSDGNPRPPHGCRGKNWVALECQMAHLCQDHGKAAPAHLNLFSTFLCFPEHSWEGSSEECWRQWSCRTREEGRNTKLGALGLISRQLASCWVPYISASISNFDDKPLRIPFRLFFTETTTKSQ